MIMASQEPRNNLSAITDMKIDLAARAGRSIQVGGHPGALDTLVGIRTLQWATADAHIRLTASVEDVDEATLVALGEGFR